jgi:DNA-binding response OmpR family regulator
MKKAKILIIEDDADIREGITLLLESEEFEVVEAENGMEGIKRLDDETGLVILDVMMPGISGLKTCEEIRKVSYVPILFLTAKSSESDKLMGLMVGGDDYLTKPFSYAELLGRVKALLRRYQVYCGQSDTPKEKETWIEESDIRIRTDFNEVWVNDKEIELSELEYKILLLMMQHPRKIFSAQHLYESVWEEPYLYTSNSTVMVHIRKLRVKIEKKPEEPEHIRTVWGKGYRFE